MSFTILVMGLLPLAMFPHTSTVMFASWTSITAVVLSIHEIVDSYGTSTDHVNNSRTAPASIVASSSAAEPASTSAPTPVAVPVPHETSQTASSAAPHALDIALREILSVVQNSAESGATTDGVVLEVATLVKKAYEAVPR